LKSSYGAGSPYYVAQRTATRDVQAYARLRATVEYFASSTLVNCDNAADDLFENLRRQGIRIGTQDLRIAAIALSLNAIVVTRNARDFSLVPGLKTEDWSLPTA
jgi:tRNA(fMet)-specific endonuclease VapC